MLRNEEPILGGRPLISGLCLIILRVVDSYLSTCRCRDATRSCLRVFRHERDKCGEHATAQSLPDRGHVAQECPTLEFAIARTVLPDPGHYEHGDGEGGLLLSLGGDGTLGLRHHHGERFGRHRAGLSTRNLP